MTDAAALLDDMTIADLAAAYRSGDLSPVDVTRAVLDRIERRGPLYNAYVTVMAEEAIAAAKEAEVELRRGHDRGPLHGVPLSLKDLVATQGVRTTAGSRVLADWVPDVDANALRRLRAAGAVVVGKTNMHEFAYGPTGHLSAFGPTLNPWDRSRITGGSSGGSGASVAARIDFGSIGSDTGGSVRMPAAYCGIVGMKPTFGVVSRTGVVPLSWTLDILGPMTRTVLDNAALLNALAGFDPSDPASSDQWVPVDLAAIAKREGGSATPLAGVRIGIPRPYFWESLEADVERAATAALDALAELGAETREVVLPHAAESVAANGLIVGAEALTYHERWLRERPGDYQLPVRQRLESAIGILATDYVRAQRFRERFRREAAIIFDQVDVLVTPTMPCVAPSLDQAGERNHIRCTSPFNLLGVPALSVPCGFGSTGLPIGLQIVGRPYAEELVYRVGHVYEQSTSWHRQRPPH